MVGDGVVDKIFRGRKFVLVFLVLSVLLFVSAATIYPNVATGTSCNTICASHGMTCESIGTNTIGTNNCVNESGTRGASCYWKECNFARLGYGWVGVPCANKIYPDDGSHAHSASSCLSGFDFCTYSNCDGVEDAYSYVFWQGSAAPACSATCTPTSWSPDPSTVCSGVEFHQASNCGTIRVSTGTKICGTTYDQLICKKTLYEESECSTAPSCPSGYSSYDIVACSAGAELSADYVIGDKVGNRYYYDVTLTESNGISVTISSGKRCFSSNGLCENYTPSFIIPAGGSITRANQYFETPVTPDVVTYTYYGTNSESISFSISTEEY